MSARFRGVTCGAAMAAVTSLLAWSIPAFAVAEQGTPAEAPEAPAHLVVLRVSERMLNSLMGEKQVDREADVRESILGTAIYGRARIVGSPGLQLAEHPDQATFQLTLTGQAHSRTTGYNGPAIIYSRSVTTFTATKQIVFEPGKGFRELPSQVTARTQTFIEGINSRRGGLIGKIVRRRAAKIAAARHAEATEIARQRAERRIAVAFDRNTKERLARLNGLAQFRTVTATALLPARGGKPAYACCTTPHYLQIATSFGDRSAPIELPVSNAADLRGAPVEIWFHESLVSDTMAAALDLLQTQITANDFFKAVSATAQVMGGGDDGSGRAGSPLGEQSVRLHKTGEWRVMELEIPSDEPSLATRVQSPNSQLAARDPATEHAAPNFEPQPLASSMRRIWTSGPYHADAEFLALDGNMVRLRRVNGVKTSIPLEKLSTPDQAWIRAHLAQQ